MLSGSSLYDELDGDLNEQTYSLKTWPPLFGFSKGTLSAPVGHEEENEEEAETVPPASTAPPVLGRGKRKKVSTTRMVQARDQRLI